eukprot:977457-Amphidinium_carterae.1
MEGAGGDRTSPQERRKGCPKRRVPRGWQVGQPHPSDPTSVHVPVALPPSRKAGKEPEEFIPCDSERRKWGSWIRELRMSFKHAPCPLATFASSYLCPTGTRQHRLPQAGSNDVYP